MTLYRRMLSYGAVPAHWLRSTPIANDSYQAFPKINQLDAYGAAHCATHRRSVGHKLLISLRCAVRSVSGYYVPPAELRRGVVP
jgi:hypothetical protein